MNFEDLGIEPKILESIKKKGFTNPTYIQEKSIPPILEGRDVVGKSATGSGKTLAFGSGIIQNIGNGLSALVLTPTRELAEQVSESLKEFSYHKKLKIATVYGGVSINPQIEKLKKAQVVVATPGRLLDHMERDTIDLSKVSIFVLDEADRMVDMGFIDDVKKIMTQLPKDKQTLLFSATISNEIKKIEKYMKNPVTISANEHVDPSKLNQIYYDIKDKLSLLVHLLKKEDSSIVFCNTRREVDFVSKNLKLNNVKVAPIHGGFTQNKRSEMLKRFQEGNAKVLVCTDVAARGLDIPGVSHVYNYDIPADPKEYVHRIGRTARAGSEGKVVNLINHRDHDNFSNVLNTHRTFKIERANTPEYSKVKKEHQPRKKGRFYK